MRKLKTKNKIIFLTAVFLAFFIFTPFVSADGATDALTGLNTAANKGYGVSDVNADDSGVMNSLPGAIGKVIGVILSLVGVAFLILMIYGGFIWMNSRGNEQEVEKAKNIIRNSIIGLLIVIAAYAITAFIGDNLAVWVVKE